MITVLQLDTDFPRPPGDVGCAQTYRCELEVIRVPSATVSRVVTNQPETIDIAPFEAAIKRAKGDLIVTSCGFLSYWQDHLTALTDTPFISSALTALDHLSNRHAPGEVMIVTFDDTKLTPAHLGEHAAYATGIIGLPAHMHLRDVISQNRTALDTTRAEREIADFIGASTKTHHHHILLECTNLPPYKTAIMRASGLPVSDILTQIDRVKPGAIEPFFLPCADQTDRSFL